jgi:hypothetical protein
VAAPVGVKEHVGQDGVVRRSPEWHGTRRRSGDGFGGGVPDRRGCSGVPRRPASSPGALGWKGGGEAHGEAVGNMAGVALTG